MSTLYYANITLNAKFTAENIKNILANGIDCGFVYIMENDLNQNTIVDDISSASKEVYFNYEKISKNSVFNVHAPIIEFKRENVEGNLLFWKTDTDLLKLQLNIQKNN
jgi:hypothetical protein